MNGEQLLAKFELYVDDATELSSTEELALLNEKYREVCADRLWEFLKATATGTLSTSVPYVTLPTAFSHVIPNASSAESGSDLHYGQMPVVFVGTGFRQYPVVSWSERRVYRDQDGYAYIDLPNSRLCFTRQPTSAESYEFDYKVRPTDIAADTSPLFPEEFHPLLYLAMAIDDDIIQRFEKARSYAGENRAKYNALFGSMALWNAQFQL